MSMISTAFPTFSPGAHPHFPTGAFRSSYLTLNASTETHTDLSVITAGGDRITLSAESVLRASAAESNYHSMNERYRLDLHATASEVDLNDSVAVSVEGQLDQQEETDLRQLVGKLEKVVKQFLGGDLEGALSKALKIGDLGTLASFQLNVQQSEQIAITQKQHVADGGDQGLQSQNAGTEGKETLSSLVNQIVDGIRDTNINLNKILKRLPHLLRHLWDTLEAKATDKDLARLFSALETSLTGKTPALDPPADGIGTLS
jgi:hypothetical protein